MGGLLLPSSVAPRLLDRSLVIVYDVQHVRELLQRAVQEIAQGEVPRLGQPVQVRGVEIAVRDAAYQRP